MMPTSSPIRSTSPVKRGLSSKSATSSPRATYSDSSEVGVSRLTMGPALISRLDRELTVGRPDDFKLRIGLGPAPVRIELVEDGLSFFTSDFVARQLQH